MNRPLKSLRPLLTLLLLTLTVALAKGCNKGDAGHPRKSVPEQIEMRSLAVGSLSLPGVWKSRLEFDHHEVDLVKADFAEYGLPPRDGATLFVNRLKPKKISDDLLTIDRDVVNRLIAGSQPTDVAVPNDCRPCLRWSAEDSSAQMTREHMPEKVGTAYCCELGKDQSASSDDREAGILHPVQMTHRSVLLQSPHDNDGVPAGPGTITIRRSGEILLEDSGTHGEVLLGVSESGDVYFWYDDSGA